MYTQCPTCRTLFRVTAAQLQAAGGKVRCGACHAVFHAPSHLRHVLPPESAAAAEKPAPPPRQVRPQPAPPAPVTPPAPEEVVPTAADQDAEETFSIDLDQLFGQDEGPETRGTHSEAAAAEHSVEENGATESAAGGAADVTEPAEDAAADPSGGAVPPALSPLSVMLAAEQEKPRRSLLAGLAWSLGILLLLTALGGQYLYAERATLAADARLRPLLEHLCAAAGCQLPPRRDISAFSLLERDIRSHAQQAGALTISAVFQNRAAFAQPYPALQVVMRDVGGKAVATRRFQPREYLPAGTDAALLAPEERVELTLDVVDPGPEAVGFEFTFH